MADDEKDSTAEDLTLDADDLADDLADEAEADTEADEPGDDAGEDEAAPEPSEAKKKADAVIAARRAKDPSVAKETDGEERKVERRVVTSRRVTPKAGASAATSKDGAPAASSKARDAKKTEAVLRTTPPTVDAAKIKGPSPWWVPALMFGLMIVGAAVIMANYMGAFGDPDNVRLVIGLVLILGGIITATQYR